MPGVEVVFPVLDAVIAGALCAWLLAFATKASTANATAWMVERAERVRIGALAVVAGMFTNVAHLAVELAGAKDVSVVLAFLAYPLWIGGATALASATWAPKAATADDTTEAGA